MRTKAGYVIVLVLGSTVASAAKRLHQKLGTALIGSYTLSLVVPHSSMAFVKQFLTMTTRAFWV